MDIKDVIRQFERENGVIAGVCGADRLDYLDGVSLDAPFVSFEREMRINPRAVMPSAKSIVVLGVPYRKREAFALDNEYRGVFSIGAVGQDYHKSVHALLIALRDKMLAVCDFSSMIFVDTGPLLEREFAKKAGLGWQGRHFNIISDQFGSFFNIGLMLVDIYIPEDKPYDPGFSLCGECNACAKACPGGAISADGLDYKKCVSYLTQKKEDLTPWEKKIMAGSLYGCDICQNVCPFNADKFCGDIDDIDAVRTRLFDIISMTNKDFREKYGHTAAGWRGKRLLQRNAAIALEGLNKNF